MRVEVVGLGIVTALGVGVDENLSALRRGESGITMRPRVLQSETQVPVGELPMTNEELHALLSIPLTAHLSRTALLGIAAVREAMRDAGIEGQGRVGLVSSTSVGGMDLTEHFYREFLVDGKRGRLRDVRMHDCGASTEAIVNYCGISGYATTISTACSSAANAIIAGVRLLRHRVVDYVVVGGCDALSAFTLSGFKSLKILDELPSRPFDRHRAGLNLGEGAGYLVLASEWAQGRGYCGFGGGANSNDAYHQTASSAGGDGAYVAMQEALERAGVTPQGVSYINVHGTGTGNNDASESAALFRIFGAALPPFSSTKEYTGHTLAAAGGVEAVLSALAVRYGILYPSLHFAEPIEEYGFVPVRKYEEGRDVRAVLSNSFGFGGNCSSLVFVR